MSAWYNVGAGATNDRGAHRVAKTASYLCFRRHVRLLHRIVLSRYTCLDLGSLFLGGLVAWNR